MVNSSKETVSSTTLYIYNGKTYTSLLYILIIRVATTKTHDQTMAFVSYVLH